MTITGTVEAKGVAVRLALCAELSQLPAFLDGTGCLEDDDGTVNGIVTTLAIKGSAVVYEVLSKQGGSPISATFDAYSPPIKGLIGNLRACIEPK